MAVWGIGAYDPGKREDKAKLFVDNGMIEVGYTKDEKPMFYRLLHLMDYGDLVFIKARYRYNKPLTIKAIGLVIKTAEQDFTDHSKVEICWLLDLTNEPKVIQSENKSDGSVNTIYQERDPEIIKTIIEMIKGRA